MAGILKSDHGFNDKLELIQIGIDMVVFEYLGKLNCLDKDFHGV